MLYRPPDGKLWDTLITRVAGKTHLFHLRGGDGLGHAISEDWLHWQARPNIPTAGPPGAWNEGFGPLTGCIVCHEGRWHLFIGGEGPDGRCRYGFLVSDDLDHWRDELGRAVLEPDPRWYRRERSPLGPMHAAWRDPCILRDEEGIYHAFLCARRNDWSAQDTGACVAHATSTDLIHWRCREPIADLGEHLLFAEVPDVFRIGDWWYLLVLDHKWGGVGVEPPGRQSPAGTFYLKSRRMTGPYHWPDEPLLIGCSDDQVGPWAARSVQVDAARWLYFHHNARHCALGVPKQIVQLPNGDLQLGRVGLLDPAGREVRFEAEPTSPCPHDTGRWRREDQALVGQADAAGTAIRVARDLRDVQLSCVITGESCRKAGVVVRAAGAPGETFFQQGRRGLAVWLDFQRRRVLARPGVYVPGLGWGRSMGDQMGRRPEPRRGQEVSYPLEAGRSVELQVDLRDAFLEVFLDDRWVLTAHLDDHLDCGDVEWTVEAGTAAFAAGRLRELPPMTPSAIDLEAARQTD